MGIFLERLDSSFAPRPQHIVETERELIKMMTDAAMAKVIISVSVALAPGVDQLAVRAASKRADEKMTDAKNLAAIAGINRDILEIAKSERVESLLSDLSALGHYCSNVADPYRD